MTLPPPWLRERDAAELERERQHLERMEKREREAIAAGMQCRPKVVERKADSAEPREGSARG